MNRITNLFNTKKNGILSVFFTAGYPNLDDTKKILKELENKGIDMVEIGIPFSDPMADGPVIQEASTAALRNGMSLHVLFEQLEDIRQDVHIPIILMGYLNPIMQYGFEAFCRKCVQTGVDGMIIPDLPFADYMADYKAIVDRYDLKMIMLITPETSEERIRLINIQAVSSIWYRAPPLPERSRVSTSRSRLISTASTGWDSGIRAWSVSVYRTKQPSMQ